MTERRLLVIDDEADFAALVGRVGERLGFTVAVTTKASEFRKVYERFEPTVVVLDIVMPDEDGIELIQWLASVNYTKQVILISGFDPRYSKTAATLGGARGLLSIQKLQKPVSLAELTTALEAAT